MLMLLIFLVAASPPVVAPDYVAEIEAWRRERDQRLRAPDGWLSLVGLTWLHPGTNRFGGAPDDDVRLPGSAPAHAGTLIVDGKQVRVAVAAGVVATLNGAPLTAAGAADPGRAFRTDEGDATPDILALGPVTLQVIERGGRLGVRVKDPGSAARRQFKGLAWFPIAPQYSTVAQMVTENPHRTLVVPDASGGNQELVSPGTLTFVLRGKKARLDPVKDGPDDSDLLVVFRDQTSGRATYGGGRFLRARRRPDGQWTLDFNRAYSPPCAYTPYATCPLPPPQNRLSISVEAGEKTPPGHP